MDTKTILAALDGGLLDKDAAVRKLCEAVDTQAALLNGTSQNLTRAIETMKKIDAYLVDKAYLTSDQRNLLVDIVVEAMGETATSSTAGHAECSRLTVEQAEKVKRSLSDVVNVT